MRKLYLFTFIFSTLLSMGATLNQPPKLRLGTSVLPIRYSADLTVVPGQDTFSGTLDAKIDVRKPRHVIWLNATNITVKEVTLGNRTAKVVPGGNNFMGISVGKKIPAGVTALHIVYSGLISKKSSAGIFELEEDGHWYVYTQFEPTDARRAFPCFDEPSFKVPWQLTLHVPFQARAFSNTPEMAHVDEPSFMQEIRFRETKPLPSYLVAFAVGPFDTVSAGKDPHGVPLRIVVPKGKGDEAQFAAEAMPQLLKLEEQYVGRPFPYAKLDAVVMPISNFAMENAGMITYGESLLLAKPHDDTIRRQRECAVVMAHEMSHQWFGDLVTTEWWDDIWLNEAFATWMEAKMTGEWKPAWHMDVSDVEDRLGAMDLDSLVSARSIRQPILSANDIANAFDSITYQKGAAVIRMFEHWIGPAIFRRGVQLYLQKNAYGTASVTQFLAAESAVAHRDVAPSFSTFLDQPGVPVVTVGLSCGAKGPTLSVSQHRYLPIGSPGATPESWDVPLCSAYETGGPVKHECDLLTKQAAEIRLLGIDKCPPWVDANDQADGYYRVAYKGGLLDKLTAGGAKQLSVPERVSLLGDVRALVDSGDVSPADALAMVPKFSDQTDRNVVTGTLNISNLAVSEYVPERLLPNGRRYIYSLYGKRAEQLGWKARPGDSDDTRLLRETLVRAVADGAEDRTLIRQAQELARQWLSDHTAIDPDMRGAVLDVAAKFGDRELFDAMLAAAKKEQDPGDREALLDALGSFENPQLAQAALNLLLTGNFDFREAFYPLLFGPLDNRQTRKLPFEFVQQNIGALMQKMPREVGADFASALPGVGRGFCSTEGRDQVEAFFKDRIKDYVGGPRSLAEVVEGIGVCAAQKQAFEPSLDEFLAKY
jgi:aminopeptidase N